MLLLSNDDLPQEESVEGAYEAVCRFHAALRDGNTTRVLSMLAALPKDQGKRKALTAKFATFGKEIAEGKRDFLVMDARVNGPFAVAFINEVKTPFTPASLESSPWYLRKVKNEWKLFPDLSSFSPSDAGSQDAAVSLDAADRKRLDALTGAYREEQILISRDPFLALPEAEDGARRIQERRQELWSFGDRPASPPGS